MDHSGTVGSPILVDDSEDEVHGELCHLTDDSVDASRELDEQSCVDHLAMRIADAPPGQTAPSHKRKRDENRSDFVQGSSSTSLPSTESKKARKRRRKLERLALEAKVLAQEQQRWYEMSSLLLNPAVSTMNSNWNSVANVNMNVYTPAMTIYDDIPTYHEPDPPSPASTAAAAATSDWVSAMALAGSLPDTNAFAYRYQWPPPYFALPPPLSPNLSPPALLERVSSPTAYHGLFKTPPAQVNLPKKPPPTQPLPIGMKPDTEPHSKHGVFFFGPSNLSFNAPNNSNKRGNGKGYTPNPACTIVMEQLPKAHRTIDFVRQWARKASGAPPVCIVVDPPSAKALVEFSSAKLARKVWGSPRLGAEHIGVKSNLLKGKPRTDLIRVWWYRVDGVGAGSGVGEIEEGEIEEDGADKKGQPESKKARKARLAKEKLEKLVERTATRAQTLVAQLDALGNRDEVDSIASSREASVVRQMPNEAMETMLPAQDQVQGQAKASSPDMSSATAVATPEDDSVSRPGSTNIPATSIGPPSATAATGTTNLSFPIPILPTSITDPSATADFQPVPIPGLSLVSEMLRFASPEQPPTTSQVSSTNLSEMKQMLLAKQRELEEKIAKSKLEMSKLKPGAGGSPSVSAPADVTVSTVASTEPKEPEVGNKAMEDRLRKLVLQSQKAKNGRPSDHPPSQALASVPVSAPVSTVSSALPSPSVPTLTPSMTVSTPVLVPIQVHTSDVSNFSLEDLAVTFITETISTLKHPNRDALGSRLMTFGGNGAPRLSAVQSGSQQTRPSASRQNSASTSASVSTSHSNSNTTVNVSVSVKEELAARQKRLEQYITESKMLMTQLTQARTKQEKDRLMALMREKSRLMDEEREKMASVDRSTTIPGNGQERWPSPAEQVAIFKMRWPTESRDGAIMIISDDECDEEEEKMTMSEV